MKIPRLAICVMIAAIARHCPAASQTIQPSISPQFLCDQFKAEMSQPLVPHSKPLPFASGGADPKFGIKTARWLQESGFRRKIVYRDFYYVSFWRGKPGVDADVTLYAFGMKNEKQARDYMHAISPSAKIKSGGLWTEAPQSYSAMAVGRVLCVMVIEDPGWPVQLRYQREALFTLFQNLNGADATVPRALSRDTIAIEELLYCRELSGGGKGVFALPADEPPEIFAYVKQRVPNIIDASEIRIERNGNVSVRKTGAPALSVGVEIQMLKGGRAEATISTYASPLGATLTIYFLKKQNGRWVVVKKLDELVS